jgi:hypothetical protein
MDSSQCKYSKLNSWNKNSKYIKNNWFQHICQTEVYEFPEQIVNHHITEHDLDATLKDY